MCTRKKDVERLSCGFEVNVYPENVTELKDVLAYLSLSGVHFSESGMEITLDMN